MAKAKLKVFPAEQDCTAGPLPLVKLSELTSAESRDFLRLARKRIAQHKAHAQKVKQAKATLRRFKKSAQPDEIEFVERRLKESNPPGTPSDIDRVEQLITDDEIERAEKMLNAASEMLHLLDSLNDGKPLDVNRAADLVHEVGTYQRQMFNELSVDAAKGYKQRRRAIEALNSHAEPKLTPANQRKAVAEIKRLIRSGKSQKAACQKLAPKYGVSARTLKRYDDSAK